MGLQVLLRTTRIDSGASAVFVPFMFPKAFRVGASRHVRTRLILGCRPTGPELTELRNKVLDVLLAEFEACVTALWPLSSILWVGINSFWPQAMQGVGRPGWWAGVTIVSATVARRPLPARKSNRYLASAHAEHSCAMLMTFQVATTTADDLEQATARLLR
eukprot:GHUV01010387.1.p1 GENE.GHUV01010387.1~~GHUV01010387.1.p1  ORF type:complete len:161 (-),score=9.54 GHUV01010387.1:310-792(-)